MRAGRDAADQECVGAELRRSVRSEPLGCRDALCNLLDDGDGQWLASVPPAGAEYARARLYPSAGAKLLLITYGNGVAMCLRARRTLAVAGSAAQVPMSINVCLAYTIAYRAPDRTLTDEEVNALHAVVLDRLARRFPLAPRT